MAGVVAVGAAEAVGVLLCGGACAGMAAFVGSRRQGGAGRALALLLLALCVWNVGYGAELLSSDPARRLAFGDLKYLGIAGLLPVWAAFILCWTGRGRLVTRRLVVLLALEPLALLLVLLVPGTHDLVRYLPADAADPASVPVAAGPLFWVHVAYTEALLLPATGLFVYALLRRSRAYWLQAGALALAAVLPWLVNLLFNLGVHPFDRIDLTPVVFTGSGAVLAWGLFRQRLLRLQPVARGLVVERMTDGVVVLDAYGHVVDVNPAARAVLDRGDPGGLVGRRARDVLPAELTGEEDAAGEVREVTVRTGGEERAYEVASVPLPGSRSGPSGRLLVLRDVTERVRLEHRLRELLADQARVTQQLSHSLRPAALPEVPGLGLAACFRPAGSGSEIGGDFYDVFPVGDEWVFSLGDVSGKGAQAAAHTANARYTLRALALSGHRPAQALRRLNELLSDQQEDETYLTLVHGRLRTGPDGVRVVLALGGHPQPLAVRASGVVEPVGVPGSVVGLLPDVEATDVEVHLQAGDSLFLFTDGVSEARREGAGLFGEGQLSASLARLGGCSPRTQADTLLDQVLELQSQHTTDDIAILVLQAGSTAPAGPPAPRAAPDPRQESPFSP